MICLFVEILQIIYTVFILFKCWRVVKEFKCPVCFDQNPNLSQVVRPSECNHYGCTSCMQDWMSSTRYNGCPLCRKRSQMTVGIIRDLDFMLFPPLCFSVCWTLDARVMPCRQPQYRIYWLGGSYRCIRPKHATCSIVDRGVVVNQNEGCWAYELLEA